MQNPPAKLVWEPLGKHVPNKCRKSSQNVCSGDPQGALNPSKIIPKTLLEFPLDLLWRSKFGLEFPEEAPRGPREAPGAQKGPKINKQLYPRSTKI